MLTARAPDDNVKGTSASLDASIFTHFIDFLPSISQTNILLSSPAVIKYLSEVAAPYSSPSVWDHSSSLCAYPTPILIIVPFLKPTTLISLQESNALGIELKLISLIFSCLIMSVTMIFLS